MPVSSSPEGEKRPATVVPDRLSSPLVYLWAMLVFLALSVFVALILGRQVVAAFSTNPGLNGLIAGVLAVGILLALQQVLRLRREVRWVNAFREGGPDAQRVKPPVLLAAMQTLLGPRRPSLALNTTAARSIMETIATRLDESRDVARYLVGLLVFLGLLGTFWGLLETIGSISSTIQSLDATTSDASSVLSSVQEGLAAPLAGMGTAFSSSLFGLAGSMVLGFLDLQVGRAQNRFYTELEDWLATVTDNGADAVLPAAIPARSSSGDELRLLTDRLNSLVQDQANGQRTGAAMAGLAESIQGLVQHMRSEQQMLRDFVETQTGEQRAMRTVLDRLSASISDGSGRR